MRRSIDALTLFGVTLFGVTLFGVTLFAITLFAITSVVGCAASPPSTELYAHAWPDERLRAPDGRLSLESFPTGTGAPIREQSLTALRDAEGFGLSSAVFFPIDRPLDPSSLPTVEESASESASVFVIDVDETSDGFGRRAPLDVRQIHDAGPFGGTDLLVALPFPGVPLRPNTLYAAVVTTAVRDAAGQPLSASPDESPTPAHQAAARALVRLGVPADSIAARAVFVTGDPVSGLRAAVAQVLAAPRPTLERPVLVEEYETFCVYRSSVDMPVFQSGAPPYLQSGGGWVRGPDGALALQRRMDSRVWITVPRTPAERYPTAIMVRAGGGGDRPLIDRGTRDAQGNSDPGTGIAQELARAAYVGLSVDGPLGGLRNTGGWDEQTAVFNMLNPIALRDNVRQTALELALFAHLLEDLEIDGADCVGASAQITLDPEPVLIGHSTGATIAPLAAAVEPRFSALVMSGAGSSWIRQVVHKQSPVALRPVMETLVGYWPRYSLHEHDPILSLMQWAGEPAEPAVYASALADRDVLVFQGVVDTYIPPPISNPTVMSLALDLAGDALDGELPYRTAAVDLGLIGRETLSLPIRANRGGHTRVVVQHPADGIEDGHEVLFQQPAARRQLRCFLETLVDGAPTVPRRDDDRDACPGAGE